MIRAGIYAIETVLSKYVIPEYSTTWSRNKMKKKGHKVDFDGDMINMDSARYHLFATKGVKCVCCGIEGKYFVKEKHSPKAKSYHFNLYGIDENGGEVLMTKDHIVPHALGGLDHIDNYQTMCTRCNNRKGTMSDSEFMKQTQVV